MSLIVEDGTGTLAAESYASVATADAYHLARNNLNWAALTTLNKEVALRKSTDYMVAIYRRLWKGFRASATQKLDWPRTDVYLVAEVKDNYEAISSTVVPTEIQNACCELALKSLTDTLIIDTEQQVLKEVIGPIATTYQASSNNYKHYTMVENILKPYLKNLGNKVIV